MSIFSKTEYPSPTEVPEVNGHLTMLLLRMESEFPRNTAMDRLEVQV